MPGDDPIRLTDILTNASTIADYLGAIEVEPEHLEHAAALLLGEVTMDDLGRGRPALGGSGRPPLGASEAVRSLAQRWFDRLERDPTAPLTPEQISDFRHEVAALRDAGLSDP